MSLSDRHAHHSPLVLVALAASFWLAAPACTLEALDDAPPLADTGERADTAGGGERVRIMAANLTSGNYQSYDPGHGIRILQGTSPDITLIQEFNYGNNTYADIRAFVNTAFGTSFEFYREGGAQIPNGVISRYPILESGEWNDPHVSNRDFAYARIDIPGPVDLWVVSVHFLTSSSTARNNQASSLISYIQANVPEDDYLVIGGDLNTSSRGEAAVSTLGQVVLTAGPYPADQNGNTNTNVARTRPYDWLLADEDLAPLETEVVLGASSHASGLVVDTRVHTPLAEISPALATDSGAPSMQHMGVIRDFLVPAGAPRVFLNEILANEPGSDPAGEFIELVNAGAAAASLGGWTLSDATSMRHTFAPGTTLGAGKAIVVFGHASAIPAGTPNAIGSSTGNLSLGNNGDTVTLRDATGAVVDTFTYSRALSGVDGVSMNRAPDLDPAGTFVLHTQLSGSSASPGRRVTGAPL